MEYGLITFSSTFAALAAQKQLTGRLPFQGMPVLREISASCGIALRIDLQQLSEARELLTAADATADSCAFYRVTQDERGVQVQSYC